MILDQVFNSRNLDIAIIKKNLKEMCGNFNKEFFRNAGYDQLEFIYYARDEAYKRYQSRSHMITINTDKNNPATYLKKKDYFWKDSDLKKIPPFLLPILWNITDNFLGKDHTIYICEGQWDALTFITHGIKAIGMPGAGNWKNYSEYLMALQKDGICNFIVVYDNDDAGKSEGKVLARTLGCKLLNWNKLLTRMETLQMIDGFEKANFTDGTYKDINDLNVYFYKYFPAIINLIPECSIQFSSSRNEFEDLDDLIEDFSRCYQLIDIGKSNKISDTYITINKNKKIIPIFDNQKNAALIFKHIVCDEYLDNKFLKSKGGTPIAVPFATFFRRLSKRIAYQDQYLKIKKVDISNLCVIKNNKILYKSDIENDILIMQDNENILYPQFQDKYSPEELNDIDHIFDLLFEENSDIIKANIISSIINEDSGFKHLLFITGSAQSGKSKTAELIARIVQNKYMTFPIGSLEAIWDNFFKYRIPVMDNIDRIKDFDENIASQLAEILTASYVTKNVRYTPAGKEFKCDIYPIITSTIDDLLDDKNYTAIKSRAIVLRLEYNEYAKNNLDQLYNNKEFINRARIFFWKKAEEYLINSKEGLSEIEHRSKNFFKILKYLNIDRFKKYQTELYEYKEYNDIILTFLKLLKSKELENQYLLPKTFNDEYQIYSPNDKINSRNLIRYYISKQILGGKLGQYTVKIKRTKDGKKYGFFTEEFLMNKNLDDELESATKQLEAYNKKQVALFGEKNVL